MPSPPPELLRQQNRAIVLATIQEQGPISRVELADLLGLNPATITRIARDLVNEGLLKEEGEGESKGAGRKRVLLHFNHGARLVIGLHVTRTQATGVIADLANHILERRTALVSGQLTLPLLASVIDELLDENPGHARGLTAICLSTHVGESVAALVDGLQQRFKVPILHDDTVTLATLGEAEAGQATEPDAFILLYLGAQSYSCLYLKGQMRMGQLGLDRDGSVIAARVNDGGLIETIRAVCAQGVPSALANATTLTTRLIFEAARQYDPAAKQAVEAIADDLAFAIASTANTLNLGHVVIAGPWLRAADLLIPALRERTLRLATAAISIVPARLGDDAALMGAVRLAIKTADTTF